MVSSLRQRVKESTSILSINRFTILILFLRPDFSVEYGPTGYGRSPAKPSRGSEPYYPAPPNSQMIDTAYLLICFSCPELPRLPHVKISLPHRNPLYQ